jgi:hypothetical protein
MKGPRRQPPKGAPEGTVWFGGPVDRCKVTLRVYGDELDPDSISATLGCAPTSAEKKGTSIPTKGGSARIARRGRWLLSITSEECGEWDVDEVVIALLKKLPSDVTIWRQITTTYRVDLFCALFMEAGNRGFGLSAETCKVLADRNLEIGFDIYAPDH